MPTITSPAARSRDDVFKSGLGAVSWSFPPAGIVNSSTLTAGTVYVSTLPLLAGDVVTNILLETLVAASGTAPTSFFVGLYDRTGKSLVISADQKASSGLTAVGLAALPVTAAYTVPTSDVYYAAVVQVGSWGTTQPAFGRSNGNVGGAALLGGVIPWGTAGTGQTTLTTVGSTATVSSSSPCFWVGVS